MDLNLPDRPIATDPGLAGVAAALELGPELDWHPDHLAASAWLEHVPFAWWLVKALRPRNIVELGTHWGVSYGAFCQAVERCGLPSFCHAVDTWQGDEHAGHYGEEVFARVSEVNERHWRRFSTLLRSSFDEARGYFGAGEIDLLHIDGLHTEEAVRHDFETWRETLSERGVVLFHDINVRERDFGVWRLWRALRAEHPHFEFTHGQGLGVLGLGREFPRPVAALFEADAAMTATIRHLFAARGEAVRSRYQLAELARDVGRRQVTERQQEDRIGALAAQRDAALAEREAALAERDRVSAERDHILAERHHILAERDHALAERDHALAERDRILAERERVPGEHGAALAARDAALAARDAALAERDAALAERDAAVATREQMAASLAQARAEQDQAQTELLAARVEMRAARTEAMALREQRAALLASSSWRLTRPMRVAAGLWRGEPGYRAKLRAMLGRPAPTPAPALPPAPALAPALAPPAPAAAATPLPAAAPARYRIVFLSGEPHTPGHSYRVERYAVALRQAGAEAEILRIEELPARLPEIASAQLLCIWRAAWTPEVGAAIDTARQAGARIIFDVDDLMIDPELARVDIIDGIRTQFLTESAVEEFYERVRRTMLQADLCTVTTEELASHARRMWLPAMVLPNGFDAATFARSRLAARRRAAAPSDGLFRIGYAGGSRTHQRDFSVCAAAVGRILRASPAARLVLFHDLETGRPLIDIEEFPALHGLESQIEWRHRVPLEQLPEEVARFDINLAPLEVGNPFCEAKSELKYFEAAIAGVCTIASPTGPYRRAIRHGETGFLAESEEEWHGALRRLLDDPEERRRVARNALYDALWNFGPDRRAELAASLLEHLRGGRAASRAFAFGLQPLHQPMPPPALPAHEQVFLSDNLRQADVTVVVPLHNYAHFVEEALDSVAAQDVADLDLVVVDDASTDDSLAVALRWAERHRHRFNRLAVLRNLVNAGLGPTRNVGFDAAETLHVLPLDADNRLLPGCVSRCLAVLNSVGAAYAYPVIRQFGATQELMGVWPANPLRFVGGNYVDAMALISKASWALVGGYDNVRFGWEDFDFWCRIAERGLPGVAVGGEPLAEYRVHASSMLRTVTEMEENKKKLMADMERRHAWLALTAPGGRGATAAGTAAAPAREERVAQLLPLLRCPVTGGPLALAPDGSALLSGEDHRWPLVAGRPVLFPGLGEPVLHPEHHVSNPLPAHVEARIRATPGPVLNLSAGGTPDRLPNVIEAEAAIFRNTDLIADAHRLPFVDAAFEGVVALNAFEHYADPMRAAAEIRRILKPGGWVLIQTAFLQPEHEAPWHFYNCTKYGLLQWFDGFEAGEVRVPDNLNPVFAFAWLASECESALRRDVSAAAADGLRAAPIGWLVDAWRDPARRREATWRNFATLTQPSQERIAAGFEYTGRRPAA
ncbi:class I SAM-dependent methyltransferase [Siccirubricoccus sp. KC 17139]|uniref:Class I SAM-dependent methyltransferase n=1 Tax=Siccirubricoccus soli TaxID=2899147 RepID=A0ABT1DB11_9PROT|nr:class I SAM-dependent methyltransferase [Siccirubricoccus soli]MCO6418420.1 class I SAM-dependent methyltransferase [Siccirubricoccus soli]MCP2684555.1 class I SAM-dependent methyltransferase [Siccirubricoccus soli]